MERKIFILTNLIYLFMKKLKSLKSFVESGNLVSLNSKEMSNIIGASTSTFYGEATCYQNCDDRMTRIDTDDATKYEGWKPGIWYRAMKTLDCA